jgi:hypothetical protein
LVSPAFQDRRHFRIANISPGVSSDSQAERLHPRIAGVSPASGCTQPLMSEVNISSVFLFALRQSAGETPAIRWSRLLFKIAGGMPVFFQDCRRDGCIPSQFCYKKLSLMFHLSLKNCQNVYPKISNIV